MPTLNSFPDLGRHFQLMKIKDKLLSLPMNGVFEIGIVHGVQSGQLVDVVKMIKDKAQESPQYTTEILGEELVQLIKTI